MVQRKRTSKAKGRRSSSGLGIFVMGLIVGSIGTYLGQGFIKGSQHEGAGSGLSSLLNNSTQNAPSSFGSQTGGLTDVIPGIELDYQALLLEEEYVLPLPPRDRTNEKDKADSAEPESATTVAATSSATETVPATSSTTEATTSAPATQSQSSANDGSAFVIQVGSYRKFEDADRVKASLALNGFESYIQKVTIEGRGDFYRVRIGPYSQYEAVERTTNSLTQLNLQSLVFRVRTSS